MTHLPQSNRRRFVFNLLPAFSVFLAVVIQRSLALTFSKSRVFQILAFVAVIGRHSLASTDASPLSSIQVPAGFIVEDAVGPGQVAYPMFGALDDKGRLFIAQSSGKNIHGLDMAQKPECRLLMLEDAKSGRTYDRITVFADHVGIPMGVLCHGNSVYVASPPDLLRFDSTNGEGGPAKRTVVLTGWNVRGTASLHGPFIGPDGWLYLTDGRHGFDIKTLEGTELKGLAARIWRLRPDGTQLQSFCGGGFDNPVEIIFAPSGEMFGTMTYFTDPKNGQRDALMHWVYGGVYAKRHECVKEFKLTGELMPPMTRFARVAPAGLMQYRSAGLGPEYRGNLFSAQFNPHRVQRHTLIRHGATFETKDEDFLTSTDPDFHPTDLLEDADGSLIVIDTGGWYVDQCPLSRISKPEKQGGIYRVRAAHAPAVEDARGLKLDLEAMPAARLIEHFADPRPMVRDRALELAVAEGDAAVEALAARLRQTSPRPPSYDSGYKEAVEPLGQLRQTIPAIEARCMAVWALTRIGSAKARGAVRAALEDSALEVRLAAAKATGLAKDSLARGQLESMVVGAEPALRREAATALGLIGEARSVRPLLLAAGKSQDRFEQHAIIYALIESQEAQPLGEALQAGNPQTRQAALIALDQMENSPLTREQIRPALADKDRGLWQTALWVASHHPGWSDEVVSTLSERLAEANLTPEETDAVREALLAFCHESQVQELIAQSLGNPSLTTDRQTLLLDVMGHCSIGALPSRWIDSLRQQLQSGNLTVRLAVLSLLATRAVNALDGDLRTIAEAAGEPPNLRLAALRTLVLRHPRPSQGDMELLLGQFARGTDATLRISAANIFGKAQLDNEQLIELAEGPLAQADPLTLPALIEAFRASTNGQVGEELVAALMKSKADLNLLSGGQLEQLVKGFPVSVQAAAKPLVARIEAGQAARVHRLEQLSPLLKGGDVGRGRQIFFGQKAACSTCHAIGNEGGSLGPDLTSIGAIRSGHDILEAIVFPSASFVPGYEPFRIQTADDTYSGLIASQTEEAVLLKTAINAEVRIPRETIRSITPGTVSLMPEGLDAALGQEALRDLLAFLQSQNGNEFLEAPR